MSTILIGGLLLLLPILAVANANLFFLVVFVLGGVPLTLLAGDSGFLQALGGINAQAAYLFAILIGLLLIIALRVEKLFSAGSSQLFLLLFILYAIVSLLWAKDLMGGIRMDAKLAAPPLCLLALLAVGVTERRARGLLAALYAACLISTALALLNVLSHGALSPVASTRGPLGMPSLTSPYMSPANFSFLILTGALLAYCTWLELRRPIHLALFAVLTVVIFLAFVRITMGALLIGLALSHLSARRPGRILLFALPAVAFLPLLLTSDAFMSRMFFNPQRAHWGELLDDPGTFMQNVDTSGRSTLWADAARAFRDESRTFGAGAGAVESWLRNSPFESELHSEVYRIYLEFGWVGAMLAALGYAQLMRQMWRRKRALEAPRRGAKPDASLKFSRALNKAALAALAAYGITLLTDNSLNYVSEFSLYVFGLAALAQGCSPRAREGVPKAAITS